MQVCVCAVTSNLICAKSSAEMRRKMKKVILGILTIIFFLIISNNTFTTFVYASMTDAVSNSLQESDNSLFTIKDGVLTGYSGDEKTIVVPEGVTKIDSGVFQKKLVENIFLPDSLIEIGSDAFYNCNNLKEITLPPNLKEIGSCAFSYCTSLTDITVPKSVQYLSYQIFQGCSKLENITIESNCNININMFRGTKWLEDRKEDPYIIMNDTLLTGKTTGDIIIPLGVKRIGENAFSFTKITSASFPITLLSIENSAFSNCVTLKEVKFANGLREIGEYAFYTCTKLTTVTLPNTVEVIGERAFYNCTSLQKINLPEGIKYLPNSVFSGCKNLVSISFPKTLQTIGDEALKATLWLNNAKKKNPMVIVKNILVDGSSCKGNVIIPDGITYITERAFSGSSITSITIPEGVKSINDYTFAYCTKLKTMNLPSTIISIKDGAFSGCYALSKVSLPKNLKTIGEYAFYKCSSLLSITFNTKLESIGHFAFMECKKLTSLSFPSSLKTIGYYGFSGCTELLTVKMKEGITQIDLRAFYNCTKLKNITFPTKSLVNIGNLAFHKTPWLTEAKKKNKMVIVSKVLYDASGCSGDVIIPNNVKTITSYAFNCRYRVDSITVPASVINISSSAFFQCKDLITLIVVKDSYAEEYAKDTQMRYVVR